MCERPLFDMHLFKLSTKRKAYWSFRDNILVQPLVAWITETVCCSFCLPVQERHFNSILGFIHQAYPMGSLY